MKTYSSLSEYEAFEIPGVFHIVGILIIQLHTLKKQKQNQHTILFNVTKQLFYSVSALKTNLFQNSWKPTSDIYNNCK